MSKDEESVTRNNPLFFLNSRGSLAFTTTEQQLLQVIRTTVALRVAQEQVEVLQGTTG
jgi:hypothetical protein